MQAYEVLFLLVARKDFKEFIWPCLSKIGISDKDVYGTKKS